MSELAKRAQPGFSGNAEDLAQFIRLASSAIRSPEREAALVEWERYKHGRQRILLPRRRGPIRKGDANRALDARVIDLRGANLDEICLGYADLRGVIFEGCSLRGAQMKGARLKNATFANADLTSAGRKPAGLLYADLTRANFTDANVSGADLTYATLQDAVLDGADLTDTNLEHAALVRASLDKARLVRTRIYGTAVWDVKGAPTEQRDLLVTRAGAPPLTVDDLKIAQFIYLMTNNPEMRSVITTMTTKSVLILGRFTPERKRVLDALREALRRKNLVPIMFDFPPSPNRDLGETVRVLAGLARFVIADISDANAIVDELNSIIPDFPSLPVQPLLLESETPYVMFSKWRRYPWVLELLRYRDEAQALTLIDAGIVPAVEAFEEAERNRRTTQI